MVGAGQRYRQFGLLAQRYVFGFSISVPQGIQSEGNALCDELGYTAKQRDHPISPAFVEGNRLVCAVAKCLADESGEHGSRTHFDKGVEAVVVHLLDKVYKPNGLSNLTGQSFTFLRGVFFIHLGAFARPYRQCHFIKRDRFKIVGKGVGAWGDKRRVECGTHLQATHPVTPCVQCSFKRSDSLHGARNYHLLWRVVVGNHHILSPQLAQGLAYDVNGGANRAHRAGFLAGLGHQRSSFTRNREHVFLGEDTGGV